MPGVSHCRRGHELVGDNVRPLPGGKRRCRICSKAYSALHYRRVQEHEPKHDPRREWNLEAMVPVDGKEMTTQEIADIAGVSRQAIDQTLARALNKLRRNPRLIDLL